MKRCPICKSLASDEAATCFGCLYSFEKMSVYADTDAPFCTAHPDQICSSDTIQNSRESISPSAEYINRKFVVPLKHFAGLYVRVRFDEMPEKKMLFPRGSLYIGAAAYNDIVVRGTDMKSRHTHIYIDNGNAYAETLETGAEVLVNGETRDGVSLLKKGDIVSLGNIDITFLRGA